MFTIVGVGRSIQTVQAFHQMIRDAINNHSRIKVSDEQEWKQFLSHFQYVVADVKDSNGYRAIKTIIENWEQEQKTSENRMFYLAISPQLFETVCTHLKASGLTKNSGWRRVIIEKPFGQDYQTAKELNDQLEKAFSEQEIYRIDHYLGKEMVQNIEVLRFANTLFEPLWNHHYIKCVQITVSETVGVGERASYYDQAGALRDMVQNHMLQMLMMISMEPPSRLNMEAIHDEKIKVLRSLRHYTEEEAAQFFIRGQYGPGHIHGQRVPGYLEEKNIPKHSKTETFVAAKVFIDNLRWANVPFYLRTGKRMKESATEIIIQFKELPKHFYLNQHHQLGPNLLIISIQPIERIQMLFHTKKPGIDHQVMPVVMDFCNNCDRSSPDAYESLIQDAIEGDQTYFTRWEEVALSWKFIDPIRTAWDEGRGDLHSYKSGSWGPVAAEKLLTESGDAWCSLSIQRNEQMLRSILTPV